MNQIRILPSGCQTWHRNILSSSEEYFFYCSTLATYIHSAKYNLNYKLEKLIAAHERTITGISCSFMNRLNYVTSGVDQKLILWSTQSENEILSYTIQTKDAIPINIDYSPFDNNIVSVVVKPGNLFEWDLKCNQLIPIDSMKSNQVSFIKWNNNPMNNTIPKLAVGHLDGSVYIYDKRSRGITKLNNNYTEPSNSDNNSNSNERGEVIDITWDPLSNTYLLVTFGSGHLTLFDTDSGEIIQDFQRQNFSTTQAAFIKCAPGDFFTSNEKAPVLYLWNVSQSTPKESIKILGKKCGILSLKPFPSGGNKFLLAFMDGSVGVFDFASRRLEYSTQPAHSETIFDVQFKPSNPNILATASYDGTIKIWNTLNMNCIQELRGQEGVIYAVSWANDNKESDDSSENRIASASSNGEIKWNSLDVNQLASTSSDGYAIIFNPSTGEIIRKYKHPSSAYGCDFSLFNKNMFVTGCHDAIIRIYDTNNQSLKPILELSGHSARVFNTCWSPLIADYLASGSDDRTIRVWSTKQPNSPIATLIGHRHNVRALVWHSEIPYIILSGSWDGSIRIWDIRYSACLYGIDDHHADVYGLVSHPQRPFVFASCSRDTSLRLWTQENSLAIKIRIQSVLEGGLLQPSNSLSVSEAMKLNAEPNVKLSGQASTDLIKKLKSLKNDLQQFTLLFDYFSGTPGVKELFTLINSLVNNIPTDNNNSIQHLNDLRLVQKQAAKQLKNQKSNYVGAGKRSERLESAAEILLKLGELKEYCEIQVELGNYERALAIAPGVSIGYWKDLTERYANLLAEKSDSNAIHFYTAIGEVNKLVAFNIKVKDIPAALLASIGEATGTYPRFDYLNENSSVLESSLLPKIDETKRDSIPITENIRLVLDAQSNALFASGSPVLSACCYLSCGDANRAVQILVLGNELLLAASICRILKLQFTDYVYRALALECEQLEMYDEALQSLQYCRDIGDEFILLAARYAGPADKKPEFYLKAGIRSAEAFKQAAEKSLKDKRLNEALLPLVAAGEYDEAIKTGHEILQNMLSKSEWNYEEFGNIMKSLNSINLKLVESVELRYILLSYSYYYASQQAIYKQYSHFVSTAFDLTIQCVSKLSAATFPVPINLMRLQEASYFQSVNPQKSLTILKELSADNKLKNQIVSIKKQAELAMNLNHQSNNVIISKHRIIPSGSLLPSGNSRSKSTANLSMLTNEPLEGILIPLDYNSNSAITFTEALEWITICPYTPNAIQTFDRLNCYSMAKPQPTK